MESNLKKMAAFFGEGPTRLRPHYSNDKCIALAKRQMELGAIGMSCATLGEAEALVRSGIQSIFLVNEIAGTAKIERFAGLSREADVMVAVDNERHITALSAASANLNVQLSIVVDVDTGLGRCGDGSGCQLSPWHNLPKRGVSDFAACLVMRDIVSAWYLGRARSTLCSRP